MDHAAIVVLCLVVLLALAGCSSAPGGINELTATLIPESEGDEPSADGTFEVHNIMLPQRYDELTDFQKSGQS